MGTFLRLLKNICKELMSLVMDMYAMTSWAFSENKRKQSCLNETDRDIPVVVSLTSFPGRIGIVHKTIITLLNQKNVKPDAVELWLANSQFPRGEADIPRELLGLKKYGLQICWCEDYRSYKKLVPTLEKHPNAIIVTVDDDVYYRRSWLEALYCSYQEQPQYVHCHRATKFYLSQGEFKTVGGGREYYHQPSFLNKLVGIGGVLYPPAILHQDVTKPELFMELAPTNDDIWFWFMAIRNDVKVCVVDKNDARPIAVVGAEKTEKLTSVNDQGEKKFWQQFHVLLKAYPSVEKKLRKAANDG